MVSNKTSQTSASASGSLYSIAKTITRFLFGEVQLPNHLAHYAGFFAGLASGAVIMSKLHKYFDRNKRDRAKVQLAVYHIIQMFKHHPDYEAMLQRPEELLKLMEPEVLRMVGKHITKYEAAEVNKELKRKCESYVSEDQVLKRARMAQRSVLQERKGPKIAPAYLQPTRGFPSATGPDRIYGNLNTQTYALSPVQSATNAQADVHEPRSDTLLPDDDNQLNWKMLTSDQKQLRSEMGQGLGDMLDIDDIKSPSWYDSTKTPCPPPGRRSSAPSPESGPAYVRRLPTPATIHIDDGYKTETVSSLGKASNVPNAPSDKASKMSATDKGKQTVKQPSPESSGKRQGYGFYYSDFSSSSSEEDSLPPSPEQGWHSLPETSAPSSEDRFVDESLTSISHPPPVCRTVYGIKIPRFVLSPVVEVSSEQDASSPLCTYGQATPQGQTGTGTTAQSNLDSFLASQTHLPASVKAILEFSATPVEASDSDDGETEVDSPISSTGSILPVAPVIPPREAQLAVGGPEAEAIAPAATTSPRGSPMRSPRLSSPPKSPERHSKDATVRKLWPRKERRSPSDKRKSVSPEQEKEQEHAQSPPPKRRRSSPLGDITSSHASSSSKREALSQRKSSSPPPAEQPQKRGRRGASSQPKAPKTPKSKVAKAAKTPGTRRTTRTKIFDGVYTK